MDSSATGPLLIEQLRTIYDAEKQLTRALPKMAKAASDQELAEGFREHAEQTKQQAARIEQIFQSLGVKPRGIPCAPMQAMIEEGQRILSADMEDDVRDIALACAARRVEHFEIASYDALAAMTQSTKQTELSQLLQETLREESETDKKLSAISKRLLKESARAQPAADGGEKAPRGTGRDKRQPAAAHGRGRNASRASSRGASNGSSRESEAGGRLGGMTTDHEEIRRWAEERGGKPSCVEGTGGKGDIGMLRLEFPGKPNAKDSKLHEITWDEFFEKFDERGLAMVFQDKTSRGQKSNFNKLVSRETEKSRSAGGR